MAGTRALIVDEALRMLGDAAPAEFFDFIERNELADRAECSRGTINYHFGGSGPFDRATLANEAYTKVVDELIGLVRESARGYRVATESLRTDRGPAAFVAALAANLDDFETGEEALARGRERLYFLALAVADRSPHFEREARRLDHETAEIYRKVLDDITDAIGRRWVSTSARDHAQDTIALYLDGFTLARRSGRRFEHGTVADAVARIFQSYTVARKEPRPAPPFEAMLGVRV